MSSSDIKMESAESSSVVDLSKDDSQCSICLQDITNKCNSDSCWHTFCFECLKRWSDVKAYCPLCKNTFKNIHHSFTNHGLHETYNVPSQKVFDHETTMHLSIVGNHRPIHDQVIGPETRTRRVYNEAIPLPHIRGQFRGIPFFGQFGHNPPRRLTCVRNLSRDISRTF